MIINILPLEYRKNGNENYYKIINKNVKNIFFLLPNINKIRPQTVTFGY